MGKRKQGPIQRKEVEGNADDAEKKERKRGSVSLPKQQITPTSKNHEILGYNNRQKTNIQRTYNTGDRKMSEINIHFSKISKIKLGLKSQSFKNTLHRRNTAAPSIRSACLGRNSRKGAIQENANWSTKANKHKDSKAYRTVSNEALCIITGLKPIYIKIKETAEP